MRKSLVSFLWAWLSVILLLLFSFSVGAQEMPRVNADSTLTFIFTCPRADEVTLDGDFGELDMRKEGDMWVYTTRKSLDSDMYTYHFLIDDEEDEAGATYYYHESSGGHNWINWRRYLLDFLPRLFNE